MANSSEQITMTPEQVGNRWGINARTVRVMLRAGSLQGFKCGTGNEKAQWRILTSEVQRYEREGAASA